MLPYWLRDALMPLPALLVMLVGVGLPWALVMLPRRDWRSRPLVVMVLLAAGPALVTGWMLVLGMVGGRTQTPALTWPTVAAGVAALSIGGWALMLHKRRTTQPHPPLPRKPLAFDERLLLLLMGVAVVIRFVSAVWYPFWEYDPLWVYAYQGKLYPLLGYIPQDIGYYPQLVPLSYAYAQLAVGQINDHVARAMFPVFQWGAGFAAYALGAQLFSRRVGIYLAALWVLYPHVAEWSIVGDLEIPLTFGFTGGAVFLLRAWFRDERRARLHDAALAGFFLGVTMWTKPTGGAFILGVGVLAAAELVRVRLNWRAVLPRLEITIVAGLACIPLGAVWYARNVLLGHPAIDFPHPFWPTQAQRSGVEFGWPLLALGVLLAALYTARLGLVPSIVWPHRMTLPEWLALGAGVGVLAAVLLPYLRDHATEEVKRDARRLGWAAL
nr:glycosyltransferase family 39 protein [Anaerolineae bacterium]